MENKYTSQPPKEAPRKKLVMMICLSDINPLAILKASWIVQDYKNLIGKMNFEVGPLWAKEKKKTFLKVANLRKSL